MKMICLCATAHANYICTVMQVQAEFTHCIKLRVGAASVPATDGNKEANLQYQNTFIAVCHSNRVLISLTY